MPGRFRIRFAHPLLVKQRQIPGRTDFERRVQGTDRKHRTIRRKADFGGNATEISRIQLLEFFIEQGSYEVPARLPNDYQAPLLVIVSDRRIEWRCRINTLVFRQSEDLQRTLGEVKLVPSQNRQFRRRGEQECPGFRIGKMVDEGGSEVVCQFCGRKYSFTPEELLTLSN